MGGFRTPARTKTRDPRWPASGNLHHIGRSAEVGRVSKADIRSVGAFDLQGWNAVTRSSRLNDAGVPVKKEASGSTAYLRVHCSLTIRSCGATYA